MSLRERVSLTGRKVIASGADVRLEAAQLRARLAELERTPEDIDRMERERYAIALEQERDAALIQLQRCESQEPGAHEQLVNPFDPTGAISRHHLSWAERTNQCRGHIQEINLELDRVSNGSFRAG